MVRAETGSATRSTVVADTPDSVSIRSFAHRVRGIASVGLTAIAAADFQTRKLEVR